MELYNVTIGNDTINMYDVFYNAYHGFEDVQYISNGPGVIMELGYQMQESTYNFGTFFICFPIKPILYSSVNASLCNASFVV